MKINITIHPYELTGYTNISPLMGRNILSPPVEQSECMEIIAEDIIDFIPNKQLSEVVSLYVSKLRHGGKIILGGTDLFEVAKGCLKQNLDAEKINSLVYGEQKHAWDFKRGLVSLAHVSSLLQQLGLRITKQRLENYKYIVEAFRD